MFKYEHMNGEIHLVYDPRLAQQSLGREFSQTEIEFARVLEEIFATGQHMFKGVAEELQSRGIVRPSGEVGPWSEDVLSLELALINQSLDVAYLSSGIGAS